MIPVTICVLARFNEVFAKFADTVTRFEPATSKILVRDGYDVAISGLDSTWQVIQGPEQFSMAGNGNLALRAAPANSDILYCGDDVRFRSPDATAILQAQAYADPTIGILSPQIIGRGSTPQVRPKHNLVSVPALEMWFPCVYLKREMIDKVGYLDEAFKGFGSDDYDYCLRVMKAGYRLAVTMYVQVEHEASPDGGPTTFTKKIGAEEWRRQQKSAYSTLRAKHGL
jgi:GT2 family glycosyltransferase